MKARKDTFRSVILLVDDCLDSCVMYAEVLEADFRVAVAVSGAQAVERASEVRPAVVVIDWSLPDMTCTEAISRIRELPGMSRVPVIVVSGYPEPRELSKTWDAYFVKPCDPGSLSSHICRMLRAPHPSRIGRARRAARA